MLSAGGTLARDSCCVNHCYGSRSPPLRAVHDPDLTPDAGLWAPRRPRPPASSRRERPTAGGTSPDPGRRGGRSSSRARRAGCAGEPADPPDVADGAAAERGDQAQGDHADDVQPRCPQSCECAVQSEGEGPDQLQDEQQRRFHGHVRSLPGAGPRPPHPPAPANRGIGWRTVRARSRSDPRRGSTTWPTSPVDARCRRSPARR